MSSGHLPDHDMTLVLHDNLLWMLYPVAILFRLIFVFRSSHWKKSRVGDWRPAPLRSIYLYKKGKSAGRHAMRLYWPRRVTLHPIVRSEAVGHVHSRDPNTFWRNSLAGPNNVTIGDDWLLIILLCDTESHHRVRPGEFKRIHRNALAEVGSLTN